MLLCDHKQQFLELNILKKTYKMGLKVKCKSEKDRTNYILVPLHKLPNKYREDMYKLLKLTFEDYFEEK